MKIVRFCGSLLALLALVVAVVFYAKAPVRSSEINNDSVVIAHPLADVWDTYLFPSPVNSNNIVAVMDINPGTTASSNVYFDQKVLYQMKFATEYGSQPSSTRPTETLVLQFSMSAVTNGTQQIYVYGPTSPVSTGPINKLVNGGSASAIGLINRSFSTNSGVTVFAGLRENPAFEDIAQWYNIVPNRNAGSTAQSCLPTIGTGSCPQGFNNPGTDYFAGKDVLSIVAEIPKSLLYTSSSTSPLVAYWATSSTTSGR